MDPLRIGEARSSMVVLVQDNNGGLTPFIVTKAKPPYPDGMGGSRQLVVAAPESGIGRNVCIELCSWDTPKVFRKG